MALWIFQVTDSRQLSPIQPQCTTRRYSAPVWRTFDLCCLYIILSTSSNGLAICAKRVANQVSYLLPAVTIPYWKSHPVQAQQTFKRLLYTHLGSHTMKKEHFRIQLTVKAATYDTQLSPFLKILYRL